MNSRPRRWSRPAALTLAVVVAAAGAPALAQSVVGHPGGGNGGPVSTVPRAPARLVVSRDATVRSTIHIDWTEVANATRYNVSIAANGVDNVVTTTNTEYTVLNTDPNSTYRIQVSSRNDAGQGSSSGVYYLWGATRPSLRGLVALWQPDGRAKVSWNAPSDLVITGYQWTVTRIRNGSVVNTGTLARGATNTWFSGLQTSRMYAVMMTAMTAGGPGPSARVVFSDPTRPRPVTAIGAIRQPGSPRQVQISWVNPVGMPSRQITGYEIGFGSARVSERVRVAHMPAVVTLPPRNSGVVVVRTLTKHGTSGWTAPVRVYQDGDPATATTHPNIDLVEQNGTISVASTRLLGRNYNLSISIRPTSGGSGFTDTQVAQRNVNLLNFRTVPDGSYLVKVDGNGTELARRYVTVGAPGWVPTNAWTVTRGDAYEINGGIDIPTGSETRAFMARTSPDFTLTSDVELRRGSGYDVLFRASGQAQRNDRLTGLAMQFDAAAKKFHLRQWKDGYECRTSLAQVALPAGLTVSGAHHVVVDNRGDDFFATIDGKELFDIDDVSALISGGGCGWPAPTGTSIGVRSFGPSTSLVMRNTTVAG